MNLHDFISNKCSQCGEDGVLQELFRVIGTTDRWCVEFGAGDGRKNSNTANLINQGWKSIQIEADEEKFGQCLINNEHYPFVQCMNRIVGWDKEDCLDFVLSVRKLPKNFEFLSIDIDGNDYWVWEAVKVFRPRVVLIEFNPTFPPYASFVQPKDANVNIGSSLLALVQLGKIKGYELCCATNWNALFIVKEEYPNLNILDNSPETLWRHREYCTWIAQGYNGELIPGGNNRLLWSNGVIDMRKFHDSIQVLPPELRGYGDSISKERK